MQLYDFAGDQHDATPIATMCFTRGEKVHDVAYRAYLEVMQHRGEMVLPPDRWCLVGSGLRLESLEHLLAVAGSAAGLFVAGGEVCLPRPRATGADT